MRKTFFTFTIVLIANLAFAGTYCTEKNWTNRQEDGNNYIKAFNQTVKYISQINQDYGDLLFKTVSEMSKQEKRDKAKELLRKINKRVGQQELAVKRFNEMSERWDKMVGYCEDSNQYSNAKEARRNGRYFKEIAGKGADQLEYSKGIQNTIKAFFDNLNKTAQIDTGKNDPPKTIQATYNDLAGLWVREDTGARITIVETESGCEVASIIGKDGEIYNGNKGHWNNNQFEFFYTVPSTGYKSSFKTISLNGDKLKVYWSGTAGSEIEIFRRIK